MGFNFRKSIKMGPVRVNLSKSGIGYSVGTKGARISKSAKGKAKVSAKIPGTGLSYSKTIGGKRESASKKKSKATKAKANPRKSTTPVSYEPIEKSWFMAVLMAIVSFVVVGVVSFIITLIIYAIVEIFKQSPTSVWTTRFILIGIPIALGALSAYISFCTTKPETPPKSTASTEFEATPVIPNSDNASDSDT